MSAQAKQWAIRARSELLNILGPFCAACGSTDDLTFDEVTPSGIEHRKGSTDQRMCHYRYQHFEFDNIQVLCRPCNISKGGNSEDYRSPEQRPKPSLQPF